MLALHGLLRCQRDQGPDPDTFLDLLYACGSNLNWDGYCNPEIEKLIEQQSIEGDPGRRSSCSGRSNASWRGGRPTDHLLFLRRDLLATHLKGLTIMVDSVFNGWRREDVWLDKMGPVAGCSMINEKGAT